jgi:hypothetical protein
MKISKTFWVLVILLVPGIGLITLYFYGVCHTKVIYQLSALNCVTEASIVYLKDTGAPPRSLNELYQKKYLIKKGEWVGVPSIGESMALQKDVDEISLSFASSPDGLAIQDGRLVNKHTGKAYYLIENKKNPLWGVDVQGVNRLLWTKWKEALYK